jgi:preprotein translocase subunit SecY
MSNSLKPFYVVNHKNINSAINLQVLLGALTTGITYYIYELIEYYINVEYEKNRLKKHIKEKLFLKFLIQTTLTVIIMFILLYFFRIIFGWGGFLIDID